MSIAPSAPAENRRTAVAESELTFPGLNMICVTGAGGNIGSHVVGELASAGAPFRTAYFSEAKANDARARGIEAATIDYERPETLRAAFQGCDKAFLLGPNALNQT